MPKLLYQCNLLIVKQAHEPNPTGKKGKVNSWGGRLDNRIHKGAHAGTRAREEPNSEPATCARFGNVQQPTLQRRLGRWP